MAGGPGLGGLAALAACWCLLVAGVLALVVHSVVRIQRALPPLLQPHAGSRWGQGGLAGTRILMLLQTHVLASSIAALALDRWATVEEPDGRWTLGLVGLYSPGHALHPYSCTSPSTSETSLECLNQIASGVAVLVFTALAALTALHTLTSLLPLACDSSPEVHRALSARVAVVWSLALLQAVLLVCGTVIWAVFASVLWSSGSLASSFVLSAQAGVACCLHLKLLHSFFQRLPPPVIHRFLARQSGDMADANQIAPIGPARLGAPLAMPVLELDGLPAKPLQLPASPYRSSLSLASQHYRNSFSKALSARESTAAPSGQAAASAAASPSAPYAAPLSAASRTVPHLSVPTSHADNYPPSPLSTAPVSANASASASAAASGRR